MTATQIVAARGAVQRRATERRTCVRVVVPRCVQSARRAYVVASAALRAPWHFL
jgi:hypothetical protein